MDAVSVLNVCGIFLLHNAGVCASLPFCRFPRILDHVGHKPPARACVVLEFLSKVLLQHGLLALDSERSQTNTEQQPTERQEGTGDGDGHQWLDEIGPESAVTHQKDVRDSCHHKSSVGGVEEKAIGSILNKTMARSDGKRVLKATEKKRGRC